MTRAYSEENGLRHLVAASAGTRAVIGNPVHPEASIVLERLGGNAADFKARQISTHIASQADLILTMSRRHRDNVLEISPRLLRRTFMLTEVARIAEAFEPESVEELSTLRSRLIGLSPDIADPIGQNSAFFAEVGAQIAAHLAPVLDLCKRSLPPSEQRLQ